MIIAFQGAKGAYSDMACRDLFEDKETLPCNTFDAAFEAVKKQQADFAVIPIDNTLAGRVADVHHLLPKSGLHIIGEHFLPIRHCLLGIQGSNVTDLVKVHSHVHAIPQCRAFFHENPQIEGLVHADTAGAARDISQLQDKAQGAIASELAAQIYDLNILQRDLQDDHSNTTRFIILSREPKEISPYLPDLMTSFVFEARNIPAALFKALGGFATNNVNMMKLESYVDSQFNAARFYCEIEGHHNHKNVALAFEELSFFAKDTRILGSYKKSPFRKDLD
jgi:prephenate dehydratase